MNECLCCNGRQMFADLYDSISLLWSWRWPVAEGEITAADVVRNREKHTAMLDLAYEFFVGDDGPYTGTYVWRPAFAQERAVADAKRRLRLHQPVRVRYRPGDPSINTLDGSMRRLLKSLAEN
jgi:hypothetical protein